MNQAINSVTERIRRRSLIGRTAYLDNIDRPPTVTLGPFWNIVVAWVDCRTRYEEKEKRMEH